MKKDIVANKKQLHVSKDKESGGWKTTKNSKKLSNHKTQAEAIKQATKKAKKIGGEVVTHGRDGKIRSKDSYGNDPNPPKDTEN